MRYSWKLVIEITTTQLIPHVKINIQKTPKDIKNMEYYPFKKSKIFLIYKYTYCWVVVIVPNVSNNHELVWIGT